jgi:hypothetical protein
VPRHEPREHERLRLRTALRETALDEEDVEPLLHAAEANDRRPAHIRHEAGTDT